VTDPEHERLFGEAMLPGGTEAFCLCPESFQGWPHRLKIYVPNIGDISVIRGSPSSAPSIAPLPRRKIRALEKFNFFENFTPPFPEKEVSPMDQSSK
jgi:hypothetical protein